MATALAACPNHAPRWREDTEGQGKQALTPGSDLRFLVVGATGFEPVTSPVSDPMRHTTLYGRTFNDREACSESRR
jgi:hypothetical protein